jgi:signal transduction histidine kinase
VRTNRGAEVDLSHEGDQRGDWDAGRLAQVVSNLIGNALQRGNPSAPVRVHLNGSAADTVGIQVVNRGRIPPSCCRISSSPSGRRTARQGSSERLGLGLFIVQAIVRAHQGTVSVHSTDDHCTRFSMLLPRRL